ncbi:MAG: hypothetical protein BWY81_01183 [Firmicutes bacterium ADurb.Bin467]|jgi:uncharacterized membrane protein|nr:MAG: hypothetical protein BWY81_01183 [Firmicutes bacterium ADurb.Bin467]
MEQPYDLTPPKYQEPPRARTLRRAARAALKGHWFRMALVMLVFTLLTTNYLSVSFDTGYNYDRMIGEYPSVDAIANVEIGPIPFSYSAPLDMSVEDFYFLPYGRDLALRLNVGWAVIPGAIQAAIFAAGALSLVLLLFGPALRLGLYESISSLYSGGHPRASQLFSKLRFFGKALWLGILEAFFTFLWMLLFIVPGIIASFRYAMAFYILWKNPEMRAIDALRESKRMMNGNKGRLFCLYFSYIGWELLAAVPSFALILLPFAILPELSLHALAWVLTIAGGMFVSSYVYVGEFEFFKDLEASWNVEPV